MTLSATSFGYSKVISSRYQKKGENIKIGCDCLQVISFSFKYFRIISQKNKLSTTSTINHTFRYDHIKMILIYN